MSNIEYVDFRDYLNGEHRGCDQGLAKALESVEAALVFHHILFWIRENKDNDKCQYNGKTGYYQSYEKIAKHFGFLNERQVKFAIQKILNAGLLIKEDHSENRFKRVSYYFLPDESFLESKKANFIDKNTVNSNLTYREDKFVPTQGQICPHLLRKEEHREKEEQQQQSLQVSPSFLDSASVVVSFKKFLEETKLSPEEQEQICKTLAKDPDPNPELLKQIIFDVFHENYKKPDSYVAVIRSFYRDRKRPTLRPGQYDEHKNQVRIYNEFLEKKGYIEIAKFNKNALEKDKYIRVINDSEKGYTTCKWCNGLKTLKDDIHQSVICIMDRQEKA